LVGAVPHILFRRAFGEASGQGKGEESLT
jgi:hypothetical protein